MELVEVLELKEGEAGPSNPKKKKRKVVKELDEERGFVDEDFVVEDDCCLPSRDPALNMNESRLPCPADEGVRKSCFESADGRCFSCSSFGTEISRIPSMT